MGTENTLMPHGLCETLDDKVRPCEPLGVMEMRYIMIWGLATWMNTFVKMHSFIRIYTFPYWELYFNKKKWDLGYMESWESKCTATFQDLVSFPFVGDICGVTEVLFTVLPSVS